MEYSFILKFLLKVHVERLYGESLRTRNKITIFDMLLMFSVYAVHLTTIDTQERLIKGVFKTVTNLFQNLKISFDVMIDECIILARYN